MLRISLTKLIETYDKPYHLNLIILKLIITKENALKDQGKLEEAIKNLQKL